MKYYVMNLSMSKIASHTDHSDCLALAELTPQDRVAAGVILG